jgi:hypothetical protein
MAAPAIRGRAPWREPPGRRARRIPAQFRDLVAAVFAFFPPPPPAGYAARADRAALAAAVNDSYAAGGAQWPGPARALLERAAQVVARAAADVPRDLLGPALDADWPPPPATMPPRWQLRRDLSGPDDWPDDEPLGPDDAEWPDGDSDDGDGDDGNGDDDCDGLGGME